MPLFIAHIVYTIYTYNELVETFAEMNEVKKAVSSLE